MSELALLLTATELVALTGYRQASAQAKWIEKQLRIRAPRRADGRPSVSRAQVEAALGGHSVPASTGPKWSKIES